MNESINKLSVSRIARYPPLKITSNLLSFRNITTESSKCLRKCEGLFVSSYVKKDLELSNDLFKNLAEEYQTYKGYFPFDGFEGIENYKSNLRKIREVFIFQMCDLSI